MVMPQPKKRKTWGIERETEPWWKTMGSWWGGMTERAMQEFDPERLRAVSPYTAEASWLTGRVSPWTKAEPGTSGIRRAYEPATRPLATSTEPFVSGPSVEQDPFESLVRERSEAYRQLMLTELSNLYGQRGEVPTEWMAYLGGELKDGKWVGGVSPEELGKEIEKERARQETYSRMLPEAMSAKQQQILTSITPFLEEAEGWGIDTSSIANMLNPQNLMQQGVESWLPQNITQQLRYQIEGERKKQANVLAGVAKEQYPEWWQKYTKERKAMGQDTEEHGWAEENFPVWLQQNSLAVESAGTEYRDKYPELYQGYLKYRDEFPNTEPFAFWIYAYAPARERMAELDKEMALRVNIPKGKATPRWMVG